MLGLTPEDRHRFKGWTDDILPESKTAATIMQRDDPMNEPPKLREESSHYADALAKARARCSW